MFIKKLKEFLSDAGMILLYVTIFLAVFWGVVLSTMANLGFRWSL